MSDAKTADTKAEKKPDETKAEKASEARPSPAEKPPEARKPQRLQPGLHESALQLAEFKEPRIIVEVPGDVPYERLFDPKFWGNVSPRVPAGAVLICRDEENSYRAELIVRNSGRGWVLTEELAKHTFKTSTAAPDKGDKHDVEFVNPNIGWRVFRVADNSTIKAGFRDREAAVAHLRAHERVLAA